MCVRPCRESFKNLYEIQWDGWRVGGGVEGGGVVEERRKLGKTSTEFWFRQTGIKTVYIYIYEWRTTMRLLSVCSDVHKRTVCTARERVNDDSNQAIKILSFPPGFSFYILPPPPLHSLTAIRFSLLVSFSLIFSPFFLSGSGSGTLDTHDATMMQHTLYLLYTPTVAG